MSERPDSTTSAGVLELQKAFAIATRDARDRYQDEISSAFRSEEKQFTKLADDVRRELAARRDTAPATLPAGKSIAVLARLLPSEPVVESQADYRAWFIAQNERLLDLGERPDASLIEVGVWLHDVGQVRRWFDANQAKTEPGARRVLDRMQRAERRLSEPLGFVANERSGRVDDTSANRALRGYAPLDRSLAQAQTPKAIAGGAVLYLAFRSTRDGGRVKVERKLEEFAFELAEAWERRTLASDRAHGRHEVDRIAERHGAVRAWFLDELRLRGDRLLLAQGTDVVHPHFGTFDRQVGSLVVREAAGWIALLRDAGWSDEQPLPKDLRWVVPRMAQISQWFASDRETQSPLARDLTGVHRTTSGTDRSPFASGVAL